ncbi:MAG: hypothetical protein LBB57_05095 [Clostridiales Family XIII bacterium]|jgi:hypothetical protein|nr:hypothetical protein [Clostridiales Family XIII bacterium]
MLSERSELRLFFVNAGDSFTDGRNIILNPGVGELFADKRALRQTEYLLRMTERFSDNPLQALRTITRALNIHESLHILYTDFPGGVAHDPRASTPLRASTLSVIKNIIEDAFIEAVGCSVYDNLEYFLLWLRMLLFCSDIPREGTVDRVFAASKAPIAAKPQAQAGVDLAARAEADLAARAEAEAKAAYVSKLLLLKQYLEYMAAFLLYPMLHLPAPPEALADYTARTKPLFIEGSLCGNAQERYTCTQRIFDIIEPLAPETETGELDAESLKRMLFGQKTHSAAGTSPVPYTREGKSAQALRRLWTDENGDPVLDADGRLSSRYVLRRDGLSPGANQAQRHPQPNADSIPFWDGANAKETAALADTDQTSEDADFQVEPRVAGYTGRDFDCASIHDGIGIEVEKPPVNFHLKRAYTNLCNAHRLTIHSYRTRLSQILNAETDVREDKLLFGQRIVSHRLGDSKKRYWQKTSRGVDVPNVAFLLMIDGSGSMEGKRREAAMAASVILHEVLRKNDIAHAIVAHRAIYGEALLRHEILVDFGAKDEEKYNLLTLKAEGGTREGLSLYWGERYLREKSDAEYNVILMISDGLPAHYADEDDTYRPPASARDAANAVRRITERGTRIVAIALDFLDDGDAFSCYQDLKEIYRALVSCTDLRRLPGQLLRLVSKELQR